MRYPEAYINFEVFENAKMFCGVASVKLPDLNFLTQTVNGAGIAGNMDGVIPGMVDAMTASFNFNSYDGSHPMLRGYYYRLYTRQYEDLETSRRFRDDSGAKS